MTPVIQKINDTVWNTAECFNLLDLFICFASVSLWKQGFLFVFKSSFQLDFPGRSLVDSVCSSIFFFPSPLLSILKAHNVRDTKATCKVTPCNLKAIFDFLAYIAKKTKNKKENGVMFPDNSPLNL